MRAQSLRKNTTSATAVATCTATRNDRYGESLADMFRFAAQLPPNRAGMRILCPRLETGKSSVTPCYRPITMAWR